MNGKSKLTHQNQEQQQEQAESLQAQQHLQPGQREFNNVEDMLRFDAAQTPVPGRVAERLQESVERENLQPPRPWWKRLFGK
jgi:hypothetical protein